MTTRELILAQKFLKLITDLATDSDGSIGYRKYADKVLEDITGLQGVVTKVLSAEVPTQAASRVINHPYSHNILIMLMDEDDFNALNELSVVAHEAYVLSMTTRKNRTKQTQKAYNYLLHLYRDGIEALREKYKYSQSIKKRFKSQFDGLSKYLDRPNYGNHTGHYYTDDDDDDYDDYLYDADEDDDDDDVDETDYRRFQKRPMSRDMEEILRTIRSDEDERVDYERNNLRSNPRYDAERFRDTDYDFSGKAALERISDKMETMVEGMQLMLNRMYGKDVSDILIPYTPAQPIPIETQPKPPIQSKPLSDVNDLLDNVREQAPSQFETGLIPNPSMFIDPDKMTREQCILLYNKLSDHLRVVDSSNQQTGSGPRTGVVFGEDNPPAPYEGDDDEEDEPIEEPHEDEAAASDVVAATEEVIIVTSNPQPDEPSVTPADRFNEKQSNKNNPKK